MKSKPTLPIRPFDSARGKWEKEWDEGWGVKWITGAEAWERDEEQIKQFIAKHIAQARKEAIIKYKRLLKEDNL